MKDSTENSQNRQASSHSNSAEKLEKLVVGSLNLSNAFTSRDQCPAFQHLYVTTVVHDSEFRTEARHVAGRFAMTLIWPSAPERKDAQIHPGVVAQVLLAVAPPTPSLTLLCTCPRSKWFLSKHCGGDHAL